jgi:hypothetical protein
VALSLPALVLGQPYRSERPDRSDRPERSERAERQARPDRPQRPDPRQWRDARYGHDRAYPITGQVIVRPPPRAAVVAHGGSRYWFADGVWYAPRGHGYVVTRPPRGIVIRGLPAFATVVTIGALTYYYANNVYYRPLPDDHYEVVTPPQDETPAMPASERVFVYPARGQSAEQQASDEYECHRWATAQSGFDPTATLSGGADATGTQRQDYQRATAACLEARGYTVR